MEKLRAEKMTPECRAEIARKAAEKGDMKSLVDSVARAFDWTYYLSI